MTNGAVAYSGKVVWPENRAFKIIDTMISANPKGHGIGHIPRAAFRDEQSLAAYPSAQIVSYLFKGATGERFEMAADAGQVRDLLDRYGIEFANVTVGVSEAAEVIDALQEVGDRWLFSIRPDPHGGMSEIRALERLVRERPRIRAACVAPHAAYPAIPLNAKEYYPIYAKCVELDLPVFAYVGMPGPRVPGWTQDPLNLDEVCWFFPELTVIMKHGGEPWVDMCVKMMLRWPNLYYATSGFAPKHYPKRIIHYANTRGADRIIYAGYWPILDYEDLLQQISALELRPHVWKPFLSDNARRVLKL